MSELRVKEILKERGMSQKELADRIGISTATMSKIISGNPSLDSLDKIAKALEVETSALFVVRQGYINCPHCGKAIEINIK